MASVDLAMRLLLRDQASGELKKVAGNVEMTSRSFQSFGKKAAGALAGIGIGAFLKQSVDAASNLAESQNKVNVVFKGSADAVSLWAKTSAKTMGQSTQQAMEAAASYGNLFTSMGLTTTQSAELSMGLTRLASDLASFNNTDPADAIYALRAAMTGEAEPMKRYGSQVNEIRIKQQALADGLIRTTKDALTPQTKALATYALMMKDTANASGDYLNTADGLANSQRTMAAEIANAQASLGKDLVPAMAAATQAGTKALGVFNAIPGPLKTVTLGLGAAALAASMFGSNIGQVMKAGSSAVSAAGGAISTALSSVGTSWQYAGEAAKKQGAGAAAQTKLFAKSMLGAGGAAGSMKAAMSGVMGLAGGPWGVALMAASAVVMGFVTAQQAAKAAGEQLAGTFDLITGKATAATRMDMAKSFFGNFKLDDLKETPFTVEQIIESVIAGGDAIGEMRRKLEEYQQKETTGLGALNLATASKMGALMNSYDSLVRDYEAGTDAAAAAGEATETFGETNKTAAAQVMKLDERISRLRDGLLKLGGATRTNEGATMALNSAMAAASDALKENGKTLDMGSEKGRANRQVLMDLATTALESAGSWATNGKSLKFVGDRMTEARAAFIKTATQMGLTDKEARNLATSYGLIPKVIVTKAEARGFGSAKEQADAIAAAQAKIDRDILITIHTRYDGAQVPDAAAPRPGGWDGNPQTPWPRALGGAIRGPGGPTDDKIPAWLSNGEYVVRASVVDRLGTDFFDHLNAGKFSAGGEVSKGQRADRNRARSILAAQKIERALRRLGLSMPSLDRLEGMEPAERLILDRRLARGGKAAIRAYNKVSTALGADDARRDARERRKAKEEEEKAERIAKREARRDAVQSIMSGITATGSVTGFDVKAHEQAQADQVQATKNVQAAEKDLFDARRRANVEGTADAYLALAEAEERLAEARKQSTEAGERAAKTEVNAKNIVASMKERAAKVARFKKAILSLKAAGLNAESLSEIIAMGPDDGVAMAEALLGSGSAAAIKDINDLQWQMAEDARAIGGAGVDAITDNPVGPSSNSTAAAAAAAASATPLQVNLIMDGRQVLTSLLTIQREQGGHLGLRE